MDNKQTHTLEIYRFKVPSFWNGFGSILNLFGGHTLGQSDFYNMSGRDIDKAAFLADYENIKKDHDGIKEMITISNPEFLELERKISLINKIIA